MSECVNVRRECLFCGDPVEAFGSYELEDSPLCLRCWEADEEDLDIILAKAREIRAATAQPVSP
jgi:hypothetical protein